MIRHLVFSLSLGLAGLLCLAPPALGFRTDSLLVLSADSLRGVYLAYPLASGWKFRMADDSTFVRPDWDDSDWTAIDPLLPKASFPDGWQGIAWFRLRFQVDSTLIAQPIGLSCDQFGASEVFLNSRPLFSCGRIGSTTDDTEEAMGPIPHIFQLEDPGPHVLAVRYANHNPHTFLDAVGFAGFNLLLTRANDHLPTLFSSARRFSGFQMFFIGAFAAFALLHGAIFMFYPKSRENFYFALLMNCLVVITFVAHQSLFLTDPNILYQLYTPIWRTIPILFFLFWMLFVYSLFYEYIPRIFYVACVVAVLFIGLAWTQSEAVYGYLMLISVLATCVEMVRVVLVAFRHGKPGARTVGVGVLVLIASISYFILASLQFLPAPLPYLIEVPFLGSLALAATMSFHLSVKVARTNTALREQIRRVRVLSDQQVLQERRIREDEMHVRMLEAENRRKTEELEEARQLQLSMLPDEIPTHPDLDIGAYMQTATEVGGDYYDFSVEDDGTLTVAIGDATGHGIKAGTMVTAMKSLFNALARDPDLLGTLESSTQALKEMKLNRVYMALTLAKFKDGTLRVAAAGMPPALVHRHRSGDVEEILLKGMPLGSFKAFPYQEQAVALHPGDTVLFMSDGFAELFNDEGDMLGYGRVTRLLTEAAGRPPQAIIRHLIEAGHAWKNGHPTRDDITFVVLRRKPDARA